MHNLLKALGSTAEELVELSSPAERRFYMRYRGPLHKAAWQRVAKRHPVSRWFLKVTGFVATLVINGVMLYSFYQLATLAPVTLSVCSV